MGKHDNMKKALKMEAKIIHVKGRRENREKKDTLSYTKSC